jgi:hypothetical protein
MKKNILIIILFFGIQLQAQNHYPLDTLNWKIKAKSYVLENYKGKKAIYLHQGTATLKNTTFLNGTIEFDVYLTERQSFPGVYFRAFGRNGESFFLRPHLSGKPDANQAAPYVNGITPWQLYFGPSYSFAYNYNFSGWTHIKVVVNNDKAQVFLDYSEKPNLSWTLKQPVRRGQILIGGSFAPMHYANFSIDTTKTELKDFKEIKREPLKDIIKEWQVSDKFEEKLLDNPRNIKSIITSRKWLGKISVEEGTAANISRKVVLYDGKPGNTVLAKVEINSNKKQLKYLEFGYSDRVVVILNGKPIYRGTNKWRTRDYRYLGTVGLFDGIYLNLKKGKNTLLLAVSEDFGGWLVTGKIKDKKGITIK